MLPGRCEQATSPLTGVLASFEEDRSIWKTSFTVQKCFRIRSSYAFSVDDGFLREGSRIGYSDDIKNPSIQPDSEAPHLNTKVLSILSYLHSWVNEMVLVD